jgi:hypothetical protein
MNRSDDLSDSEQSEADLDQLDEEYDAPSDHRVRDAALGFFTGASSAILVPGIWSTIVAALFDTDTATKAFWAVLLFFAVPAWLISRERSRRFGWAMLLGIVVTVLAVVVAVIVFLMVLTAGENV